VAFLSDRNQHHALACACGKQIDCVLRSFCSGVGVVWKFGTMSVDALAGAGYGSPLVCLYESVRARSAMPDSGFPPRCARMGGAALHVRCLGCLLLHTVQVCRAHQFGSFKG
jgi:hypothetical protein